MILYFLICLIFYLLNIVCTIQSILTHCHAVIFYRHLKWYFYLFLLCYILCFLSSRCERLPCEQNTECQSLPLRISFYNITFSTNIPIPAAVFRMGPSSSVPGDDIQVFIMNGDAEGFFSIQKAAHGAVVSVQRPLPEPRDFLLTVEIRLIRYGIISRFVAKIAVFVVNDQPIVPNSWSKP